LLNKVDLIERTLCLQVSQLCLHSVFKLAGHGCMCIANHTHAAKSQFTLQTKLQRRITLQVFFLCLFKFVKNLIYKSLPSLKTF